MSNCKRHFAKCLAVRSALTAMGMAAMGSALADSPNDTNALQEIIVTATKRDESLIKVPDQITVINENAIASAGIVRPVDFLTSIPNVTFYEDNAGAAYINIRGQATARNSDPNVAIVVDGVSLTSYEQFNQDLFNIQSIEVLKGPQSALYGRNAAAGAIVVTTKPPTDDFEGDVTFSRANFNTTRFAASVSGPITSDLKFDAGASLRSTDGPFTDITSGEHVDRMNTALAQIRLLYTPTDKLAVDFKINGHQTSGGGIAYQADSNVPLGSIAVPPLNVNNATQPFISNVTGTTDERFVASTLKVDYDFDFAKLTSISGWDYLYTYVAGDSVPYIPNTGQPGATVQSYLTKDTDFSQELRLTSPGNQPIRWQVGVYFLQFLRNQGTEFNEDNQGYVPSTRFVIDPPGSLEPTTSINYTRYRTINFAPFASVQWDIFDTLHLDVAGRYDTEQRSVRDATPDEINTITGANYNQCIAFTGVTLAQCRDSKTFHQFEPKVSLSYDFSRDLTSYVSYGRGFKSGGFNPVGARTAALAGAAALGVPASSVFVQDAYPAETSKTYEIGSKWRLFDRHLSLNLALFYTDVTGAQQFEFDPLSGLQTIISVGKERLRGGDFDFTASLPMGVSLFGGYGYTDGKITAFAANPSFVGNVTPDSLRYTANLGVSQTTELTQALTLTPRIEYNREGRLWNDFANTPGSIRDPLDLLKARLTVANKDGKWDIAAYGDNLLNKQYFQEILPIESVFSLNVRGWTRTFGLEATKHF